MGINVPLYFQIESDLREKIVSGEYQPGDLIPSERELVENYKVSRLTVREAIKRLVAQGIVKKIQGKGTYVTEYSPDYLVGPLNIISEVFLLSKYTIETKVLSSKKMKPDKEICEKLQLEECENNDIFYLERVRYANGTPYAYVKCYLPYSYVENIETFDFTQATLYRTMEDYFRLELYEAYDVIEATTVNKRCANLLDLKPGAPVLLNQRTAYLQNGTIIEFEKLIQRSDIFKYRNKLVRRAQ